MILKDQIDYLKMQISLKDDELQKKNDMIQQFVMIIMKDWWLQVFKKGFYYEI